MYTLKITIFTLLSSFFSNKIAKSPSLKKTKKRTSKEGERKENLAENTSKSNSENNSENTPIYYLPVHLM